MFSKCLAVIVLVGFVAAVSGDDSKESLDWFDKLLNDASKESPMARTFGHNALKRLSFIFLPVMFTLGVISTLLMAIALVSVKNLAIGVILLIVGISQAVARLIAATTTAPVLSYSALHSRSENYPQPLAAAVPWPIAAQATGPVISPWARSDTMNAVES